MSTRRPAAQRQETDIDRKAADMETAPHPPSEQRTDLPDSNGAGAEQAPDPFNLEALRSAPLEDQIAERVMISVPVRRPGRAEFVRVHPGAEFVVDCPLVEHENGMDRELYWVAPSMWVELAAEYRRTRLHTAQTKTGTTFLWPIKLPASDSGGGRRWAETALEIADLGKTRWVRLQANKGLGGYEALVSKGDLGEPIWPDKTFRELIELAFKGRIIDRADHAILRELRGEI